MLSVAPRVLGAGRAQGSTHVLETLGEWLRRKMGSVGGLVLGRVGWKRGGGRERKIQNRGI